MRIVALDFETADSQPDSACAVGLAVVEDGKVAGTFYRLIRPPRSRFQFTRIHGIRWEDVAHEADFASVWRDLAGVFAGASFIAAHYAAFDRRVLRACCAAHAIPIPETPFLCTVELARALWNVRPTRLPDVCRHLCITLNHHHAGSDAEACARIVQSAIEDGWTATPPAIPPEESNAWKRHTIA